MKLLIFDFIISYKSKKINLIDILSKRLNYKNKNKTLNKFLFILQQKLIKIKKFINFIFIII